MALELVGGEDLGLELAAQHARELPWPISRVTSRSRTSEIERVHHADVHALSSLRRVRVRRVAKQEGTIAMRRHARAQPLADLVDGPPGDRTRLEGVGRDDLARRRQDRLDGDRRAIESRAGLGAAELDVEADHLILARDDEDRALAGRVDRDLGSDVWEVGDGHGILRGQMALDRGDAR